MPRDVEPTPGGFGGPPRGSTAGKESGADRFLTATATLIPRLSATPATSARISATPMVNLEASSVILYLDNDNVIELQGLKDNGVSPALFLNAASVTARVTDPNAGDVEVMAPETLSYIAGSDGNYRGVVDKAKLPSASINPGTYTLEYAAAESGADYKRFDDVEILKREGA